ncbi:MAG: 3-methyl-2-oxobutanoate hydroxymethyltransferase [Halothiobacillaceae bacterium]
MADGKPVNLVALARMKAAGQPVAMLTAYDASFARVADEAGVDALLVGDSLGMVVQGHADTLPVTVDEIAYHCRAVRRGASRAMVIADMPFMSYATVPEALRNAAILMKEGGAQMVKLEGGGEQVEVVTALAAQGVPVCAHLGLQPQSVHKLGGYRVQGRAAADAERMLRDAQALVEAGADLLVVECVPAGLAARLAARIPIPVIGIGAGSRTDGQVLVLHDVLGLTERPPRFSRCFLEAGRDIPGALAAYVTAVRDGSFPTSAEQFD